MYFSDGSLIDAEYSGDLGIEAAYSILAWETPAFYLAKAEKRITRISLPIPHVLLNASTRSDEEKYLKNSSNVTSATPTTSVNPALTKIIDKLVVIPGVRHYYILNKQGKLITQSDENQKISDFIAYCIVSGQQMKEVLEAKGLQSIRIKMNNDNLLLILPISNITIALMLAEDTSLGDVFSHLRKVLMPSSQKNKQNL